MARLADLYSRSTMFPTIHLGKILPCGPDGNVEEVKALGLDGSVMLWGGAYLYGSLHLTVYSTSRTKWP